MGWRLDRSSAGSRGPLRLGFLGFAMAGLGVVLGFGVEDAHFTPEGVLAAGLILLGIAVCVVSVAWAGYNHLKARRRNHGV